jgi:hypothetical protein
LTAEWGERNGVGGRVAIFGISGRIVRESKIRKRVLDLVFFFGRILRSHVFDVASIA